MSQISPCFSDGFAIRFVSLFVFLTVPTPSETQRENGREIDSRLSPGALKSSRVKGQHDFKMQLPLYFLQPDWLMRSFPNNLEAISHPCFAGASVVVWFSGRTVRNTDKLTNRMANSAECIKTENIGDLRSRTERSKTQHSIGAGKEITLLIYEHKLLWETVAKTNWRVLYFKSSSSL